MTRDYNNNPVVPRAANGRCHFVAVHTPPSFADLVGESNLLQDGFAG
jgi:hypothetical protein